VRHPIVGVELKKRRTWKNVGWNITSTVIQPALIQEGGWGTRGLEEGTKKTGHSPSPSTFPGMPPPLPLPKAPEQQPLQHLVVRPITRAERPVGTPSSAPIRTSTTPP
jgi:hypothetical protein